MAAALDIGSSKICCLIAEDEGEGVMRVLGVGHTEANGARGGAIVDMDAAEEAVRAAVHAAEKDAGETVRSVRLNLSGGRLHSELFEAAVELDGRAVGDADVHRAHAHSRRYAPPADRELVHLAPVDYAIDGAAGIREPRGIFGERLSVRFHAASAGRGSIRTLKACAGRCHLDVDAVLPSAYASGRAVLSEDEMSIGAVCVDMGAGATDIAAFLRGSLVFVDSVPMGGAHVTSDVAYGLATSPAAAERLKTVHGSVLAGGGDDREPIEVPEIGGEPDAGPVHVPRARLIEIVRPRLEETFRLVRERLDAARLGAAASRRVVLCGGASALSGVREVAAQTLDRAVRLGRPRRLRGLPGSANGPAFATCAGMLVAAGEAARSAAAGFPAAAAEERTPFGRFGQWLRGNF